MLWRMLLRGRLSRVYLLPMLLLHAVAVYVVTVGALADCTFAPGGYAVESVWTAVALVVILYKYCCFF